MSESTLAPRTPGLVHTADNAQAPSEWHAANLARLLRSRLHAMPASELAHMLGVPVPGAAEQMRHPGGRTETDGTASHNTHHGPQDPTGHNTAGNTPRLFPGTTGYAATAGEIAHALFIFGDKKKPVGSDAPDDCIREGKWTSAIEPFDACGILEGPDSGGWTLAVDDQLPLIEDQLDCFS
ncbi:MAG: hypothetical protein H7838_09220 [Magnetococcus sp. DMHC-8]